MGLFTLERYMRMLGRVRHNTAAFTSRYCTAIIGDILDQHRKLIAA
jgi:hypothetical protein